MNKTFLILLLHMGGGNKSRFIHPNKGEVSKVDCSLKDKISSRASTILAQS
jgi:hypothetical protein